MKNKGISLIVLVITIIVMIIIAATIIISLSNTNIISKAQTAVDETNLANIRDAAALKYADIKTGAIPRDPYRTIGQQIEMLLIDEGTIAPNTPVIINSTGGLAENTNGVSTLLGGPWMVADPSELASSYTVKLMNLDYSKTNVARSDNVTIGLADQMLWYNIIGYSGELPSTLKTPNFIDGRRIALVSFAEGDTTGEVTEIDFSYGITGIGSLGPFPSLSAIHIPDTCINIVPDAFSQCPYLTTITINQSPNSILANHVSSWGLPANAEIIWAGNADNDVLLDIAAE